MKNKKYNYMSVKKSVFVSYQLIKRVVDVLVSLLGVICLSPLLIILILIIVVEDKEKIVFFKQDRVGLNGNSFKIYKFRSMKVDADKQLRNNKKLYKKYIENGYKLEPSEDPRITKIGGFLRKTSLDELPQLFNVLKGDMSLVGPRPIIFEELKEYEQENKLSDFLSMKPGITGIWATSGRSNIGYPERVYLELKYKDNCSILCDFQILLKTFEKVVKKEGAY